MKKYRKIAFFLQNIWFSGCALAFNDQQYLRTPPGTSLFSVPFPRSYGRKMQPMTSIFFQKSTFFSKNRIFFAKYLVMCIFCCTFAPLFGRRVKWRVQK